MKKQILNRCTRRTFFAASALGLAGLGTQGNALLADEIPAVTDTSALDDVVESFPCLQNPTGHSMNVLWTVKRPATGWVEYGRTEALGQIVRPAVCGLYPWVDRFLAIPIENLLPNTTYFYRTVTVGMDFPRYAQIKSGTPIVSEIFSFRTPGPQSERGSFVVANDTHETPDVLNAATKRFAELNADYTIFNGDLAHDTNSADQMVKATVLAGQTPFAATHPLLVAMGNHDHRGPWARNLEKLILPWQQDSRFRSLGRNFALRQGPIALIGMDTGEDKPDTHPVWAGLSAFGPYRQLQTEWLAATLAQPEIESAPFIVVFCHIPLFDDRPDANPGNILEGYASWQQDCAEAWAPLFQRHGVQAVIVAHEHRFRADAPCDGRSWLQVCGGGCNLQKDATLIHGQATSDKLTLTAEKLVDGSQLGSWDLTPRS
ncbi:MAG: metallophosphoesterase family protein [Planctomycetia bacterium]|nr:metallophosphoesterase family protein [Planctomycetia bacterium]